MTEENPEYKVEATAGNPEKKKEETTICPMYNGKCITYNSCPINNAIHNSGYDFEGETFCKTKGVITAEQVEQIKRYKESRLVKINETLARLDSEREEKSKLAKA